MLGKFTWQFVQHEIDRRLERCAVPAAAELAAARTQHMQYAICVARILDPRAHLHPAALRWRDMLHAWVSVISMSAERNVNSCLQVERVTWQQLPTLTRV